MDAAKRPRGRARALDQDAGESGIGNVVAQELEAELLTIHQGEPAQTPQLRGEANDLKLCFTRYAFQCIGLCSLALAGIVQVMFKDPFFGVAAASIVPLVCAVGWFGTYKYIRSNRAFGYELYLERTRKVPPQYCGRWVQDYRLLSWEEAMHAWRAIQPTLYEAIYRKSRTGPDKFQPKLKLSARSPVWFLPAAEIRLSANAKWLPGRYLTNILILLYLISGVAVGLLGVTLIVLWLGHVAKAPESLFDVFKSLFVEAQVSPRYGICLATLIAALLTTIIRSRIDFSQCRKIRMELLSIPACAIIWQAVVVAHYTAVERSRQYNLTTRQLNEIAKSFRSRKDKQEIKEGNAQKFIDMYLDRAGQSAESENPPDGLGLAGYSFWLGQEAASLANCALDIHGWIANRGPSRG